MIILVLRMIGMIIPMLRMIILMGQDDGSWFMAHGPRLMAHGQGGPARPWSPGERRARTRPDMALPLAPGPGRPPLAMSHEP